MLRYANHSKKNANSYPRVVFSAGHHRIGLFAKRHIYQGEEIKFDYDGQNILSKQFPWINDEKAENSEISSILKRKKSKKKL
jgi:SET domain-containing protein